MPAREKLIEATADLLREHGYRGTSPAMIQKKAGLGQGSMYHHFAGKADLAACAMRRTAEQVKQAVLTAAAGKDSAGKIRAFLDMEREPLLGCRVGRLVQESEVVASEELLESTAEFFCWLRQWAADVLLEGQSSGELRPDFDAQDVAALVVATVQGSYVLARAESDPHVQRLAVAGVKTALDALILPR